MEVLWQRACRISLLATESEGKRLTCVTSLSQAAPKTWEAFPQLVTPVSHGAEVFKRFLLQLRKPHFAIFGSLVV